MEIPSPPSALLSAPIRQQHCLTFIHWPKTPYEWLKLPSSCQNLATRDDRKIDAGPIPSILTEIGLLAEDTIRLASQQGKTKDAVYWARATRSQIDYLQKPVGPARRAALVIGAAMLVLCVSIPQIAIAYRLQEWSTVARAIGDHWRTYFMFAALARTPYINLPLIWLFAQNRVIGSLPSIAFYSVPAFCEPLRYLYGTPSYTYAVIPALLVWLALISFSGSLRVAWTRCSTRKEPLLTGEQLEGANVLLDRWQQLVFQFERQLHDINTSDLMGQNISLVKKYIENTCSALQYAGGSYSSRQSIPPAQTLNPRSEKFAILVAALACMLIDILINLDKLFFVTEKVAINTWVSARLFWCAWSLYQSRTDMLKLCCDLLSGPTLSLILVTPAKAGHLFDTDRYLIALTLSHTAIIFLLARHTGLLYRFIGFIVRICANALRLFAKRISARYSQQGVEVAITEYEPEGQSAPGRAGECKNTSVLILPR
jgi:hypothetical protein